MQAVMNKQVVAAKPARASSVVVRASVESRRAVLGGFLATGAALFSAQAANAAATPVDLIDDRAVRSKGFDLIYEARELDLPQSVRDGLDQARGDLEATKKRIKAAEANIDKNLETYVSKKYWTEAREELRRQVGTLRFDLNTLASAKGSKAEKKAALALKTDFIKAVEELDFSIREKDQPTATAKLAKAKAALDSVIAAVL